MMLPSFVRIRCIALACLVAAACAGQAATNAGKPKPAAWQDPSPHSIQFVSVENNVHLEVLDWGGSGRPVVLLAGLGNTAHVFDEFAPKLSAAYHVYGITRRGFGASSSPATGYSADRLGDDVLSVLDSLKLDRPVLVGHSIGGEELSSVGTRHPEKLAGLIYLDAGYGYAYYDRTLGDLDIDSLYLQRMLDQLGGHSPALDRDRQQSKKLLKQAQNADTPREETPLVKKLLQTNLPRLKRDLHALQAPAPLVQLLLQITLPLVERELQRRQKDLQTAPASPKEPNPKAADVASFSALRSWLIHVDGFAPPEAELRQLFAAKPNGRIGKERDISKAADAIEAGLQRYTDIRLPLLVIYSLPHKQETADLATLEAQANAFERGISSARVVRVPHADHFVFLSNEADVLREMQAFLGSLPELAKGGNVDPHCFLHL
jgi:non-heme chloroperoxidase